MTIWRNFDKIEMFEIIVSHIINFMDGLTNN